MKNIPVKSYDTTAVEGAVMGIFDGRQLRAARALAGLSAAELAKAAAVTPRTVLRLEAGDVIHVADKLRHGHVSREVLDKIVEALARHGVELVPEDGDRGAGARWVLARARRGHNV